MFIKEYFVIVLTSFKAFQATFAKKTPQFFPASEDYI